MELDYKQMWEHLENYLFKTHHSYPEIVLIVHFVNELKKQASKTARALGPAVCPKVKKGGIQACILDARGGFDPEVDLPDDVKRILCHLAYLLDQVEKELNEMSSDAQISVEVL